MVAETNIAVDNILRRLLPTGLPLLRLGKPGSVSKDLVDTTLKQQLYCRCMDARRETTTLVAAGGGARGVVRDDRTAKKTLNAADVVFATCSGAGEPLLATSGLVFDLVMLDEATMSTEPSSVGALVYGARQLVLIGDSQQLAPTLGMKFGPKQPQTAASTQPQETFGGSGVVTDIGGVRGQR